jgi:hypothetical protein
VLAAGLGAAELARARERLAALCPPAEDVEAPGFRVRLDAIEAAGARIAEGAQGFGGGDSMLVAAAVVIQATADPNAAVVAAGLKLALSHLERPPTNVVDRMEAHKRASASLCAAAAAKLADRKSGTAAADCLHAAAAARSLTLVLAVLWPLVTAAAPAPAAAAMQWLAAALARLAGDAAGALEPGLVVAACAAVLRSPAAATRKAALEALAALDRLCPVLEAVAAAGFPPPVVGTLRVALATDPPPRVVFDRTPPVEGHSGQVSEPAAFRLCRDPPLEFDSAFECGNLARAAMVDVHEYDLWLAPDTNVTNVARIHTQWFFFRVRGMRAGVRYRFNIQNFEKSKSLYSTGMQPLVYSEAAAARPGGHGWRRAGADIAYRKGGPRPCQESPPKPAPGAAQTPPEDALAAGPASATAVREKMVESEDGEALAGAPAVGDCVRLLRKRLLREGAVLSSGRAGAIEVGTRIEVLELVCVGNGGRRSVRLHCARGWLTWERGTCEACALGWTAEAALSELPSPNISPDGRGSVDVASVAKVKVAAKKARKKKTRSNKSGDAWAEGERYYRLEFTLEAEVDGDTLYVAHAYPYSYTQLQRRLGALETLLCVERRSLCSTAGGRRVEVLTITSPMMEAGGLPEEERQRVVISSRVHPGETNASWVLEGVLDCLTAENELAARLRGHFVFTVLPMLNPDGAHPSAWARCIALGWPSRHHTLARLQYS